MGPAQVSYLSRQCPKYSLNACRPSSATSFACDGVPSASAKHRGRLQRCSGATDIRHARTVHCEQTYDMMSEMPHCHIAASLINVVSIFTQIRGAPRNTRFPASLLRSIQSFIRQRVYEVIERTYRVDFTEEVRTP